MMASQDSDFNSKIKNWCVPIAYSLMCECAKIPKLQLRMNSFLMQTFKMVPDINRREDTQAQHEQYPGNTPT